MSRINFWLEGLGRDPISTYNPLIQREFYAENPDWRDESFTEEFQQKKTEWAVENGYRDAVED